MFLRVSSFKGKSKTQTSKTQNKCIRFCLNLPPITHIDPSHFRKINWIPVSDRVEYCSANRVFKYWNGIVKRYIYDEMFKSLLCRYSTRSQMALDNKYKAKKLILFRAKIWSKIDPSIKNVRTSSSFTHAIKKNILLHLQS